MIKSLRNIQGKAFSMKNIYKILFKCSMLLLIPAAANAAGTYYTGGYQSPQQSRYTQKSYNMPRANTYSGSQGLSQYTQKQYSNAGYTTTNQTYRSSQQRQQSAQKATATTNTNRNGLYLDAGISKQTAMWQFEMNSVGSKLHYDNVDWLTFDIGGKYIFDAGKTKLQIDAGFLYGIQTGESTMIDDDITNGGTLDTMLYNSTDGSLLGGQYTHALSTGITNSGNMLGLNAGFGLTDFFAVGKIKITPSIGWRYLKYKLETKNTKGMVATTYDFNNSCYSTQEGEQICLPALLFFNITDGKITNEHYSDFETIDLNNDGIYDIGAFPVVGGSEYIDTLNTYVFAQEGVSHSYEVEWSGPYLALDMLYDINLNNNVSARVELGLPSYTATGDQPYRFDWAHPKSVQDKGGIGSAIHFGAGANWMTKITDSVSLSVGVTYDYYKVSDADANTFLNGQYYQEIYDSIFNAWQSDPKLAGVSLADIETLMLYGGTVEYEDGTQETFDPNLEAAIIDEVRQNGWKVTTDSEIESFYKSLGIRIGINAKF